MRKITLSTLLLSSLIITACGGGGGGSNNSNSVPITKLENSDLIISKNDFKRGELNNVPVTYQGKKVGELSGYNRTYSFNGAFKKSDNIGIVEVVGDKTIRFAISEVSDAAGTAAATATSSALLGGLAGIALSKSLTAAWNASDDPTRDMFYMGYETPISNIPKNGIVTYEGNASRYDNITQKVKNIGTSEFIANFDTKKIKGNLSIDGIRRDISLKETDIKGNKFNGEAVAGESNILFRTVRGQYEGKFYGPNAEEIAGKATFSGEAIVGQLESLNTSFSGERIK